MTQRTAAWCAAVGVGIAALYTLSPMTWCVVAVGAVAIPPLLRDLERDERRWVSAIVALALIARLIAIGGLFLRNVPNHDDQFVGATTGDEAYAMSRALRTRDIVHGTAGSKYDFFVSFDEYGRNRYVTILTGIQLVFGPTPYSVRLLNTLLYLVGALLLFRVSRRAFGPVPAAAGLAAILFWPTLFLWSISLLKEPLYFLLSAAMLTAVVTLLRSPRWLARAGALLLAVAAAAAVQDLRPGAVALLAAGIGVGLAAFALFRSIRLLTIASVCALIVAGLVAATPSAQDVVIQRLEAAAKTHSGHVFTVGHDYKLLDAGFYFSPSTPAASSLKLTRPEAARFVLRAVASFFVVPAPWQLRSARELAYMPEQIAWYALVALLPVGIIAAYRRDPLVTCLLVGFALPTAAALALTNGNVGTLLRLRGLVLPSLLWIGAVGFCAMLGTAGQPRRRIVDDNGRLFGRVNLFDAAVAGFAIVLLPIAYGTYLLFRTPTPHIDSVTRAPITREERRVAGGSRLTAKLKVRGVGLRPMLRASVDDTPTLGFVFEGPNSADVLVGDVPPGRHDLILYDGVQEVARLPKSVEISAVAAPRVAGIGALIHLDDKTADALAPGGVFPERPEDRIVKLGPRRQEPGGSFQRRAEILLQCDADPNEEGCAVGGVPLRSAALPTIRVAGPAGAPLSFALTEVLPAGAPVMMTMTVRFASPPEVLRNVHSGDRDDVLDDRAATVVATRAARTTGGIDALDVTLRLGLDQTPDGWTYRGRTIKPGAPFRFATEQYVLEGTTLSDVSDARQDK